MSHDLIWEFFFLLAGQPSKSKTKFWRKALATSCNIRSLFNVNRWLLVILFAISLQSRANGVRGLGFKLICDISEFIRGAQLVRIEFFYSFEATTIFYLQKYNFKNLIQKLRFMLIILHFLTIILKNKFEKRQLKTQDEI